MKKQKRQMIIIVAVLLLLILGYLLLRANNARQEALETQAAAEAVITVTDFDASDITALSYQLDGETLSFTKTDDVWNYDADTSIDLDEDAVEDLISTVSNLTAETKIDEYNDLSEYGLEEPVNTIKLSMESGDLIIYVGSQNQVTGNYYIQIDGQDELYLISTDLSSEFASTVEDLTVEEEETESTEETESAE